MCTWKQYLYEGKEKPCGLDFDCPEDPSTYLLFPWLICRPSASKRFKPLRLMTFDLGDIWSRNRWCELAWTFEKKISQILMEEPLSMHNSHEHSAQSATLWFFPHPSHVSFSCPAPWVRQTKRRFSYGFRLGSIRNHKIAGLSSAGPD